MDNLTNCSTENVSGNQNQSFKAADCVFAWFSLIAGYIFCRAFPIGDNSLGGAIVIAVLYVTAVIILAVKHMKLSAMPVIAAVSAIVISLTLVLSANRFLHFFAYAYALVTYCYFIYTSFGNTVKKGFSDFILIDYVKALLVMPFYSFDQLFKGLFPGRAKGSGKFILKLLLGIAIAFIPTTVVFCLLAYDDGFFAIMEKIIVFILTDAFSHMASIVFAIPIGLYIFGLYVSSLNKKCSDMLTVEKCKKRSADMKVIPTVTAVAGLAPLICIYIVFFISQWKYYISGFTGYLPEELSYAQYAREGFFRLCIVSVINLVIILWVVMCMKRKDNRPTAALKILAVVFSVITLVLISTAVAKMFLYIDYYGLTQKRVYATWMMFILAVVFLVIILKQFIPKMNAAAVSFFVCVALFAVLALSNVDALIAKYNVSCYMNGSLSVVDVEALSDLGDAAVPEMVHLAEKLEEKIDNGTAGKEETELYNNVIGNLRYKSLYRYNDDEKDLFSYTLPYILAENAIERIDFS